jgi:UDP:flavonoid glycosyltransferase YjiC (YdhE family)
MSRIVFATWNGGGNLLPALGIARELNLRGHPVAFLGQETQRRTIEEQHLAFTAFAPGPERDGLPATAAEREQLLMRDT